MQIYVDFSSIAIISVCWLAINIVAWMNTSCPYDMKFRVWIRKGSVIYQVIMLPLSIITPVFDIFDALIFRRSHK